MVIQMCIAAWASCYEAQAHAMTDTLFTRRRISIQLSGRHDPDAMPERLFAARKAFTATLASAAAMCRQAVLMSIHPKCADYD